MSLRYEQYWALLNTRRFMRKLLNMRKKDLQKWPIDELRREVYYCIKHFPPLDDNGQPYWSEDDLTKDRRERDNGSN